MTTPADTAPSCPPPCMRTMILAESLALCLALKRPVPMLLNPRPELRAKTMRNVSDETLLAVYKELLIASSSELAAARRDRDLAIAESARRYDCHGGPGTTEPACGGCVSCLTRDLEAARRAPDQPPPCPNRDSRTPCAFRTRAPFECRYCGNAAPGTIQEALGESPDTTQASEGATMEPDEKNQYVLAGGAAYPNNRKPVAGEVGFPVRWVAEKTYDALIGGEWKRIDVVGYRD